MQRYAKRGKDAKITSILFNFVCTTGLFKCNYFVDMFDLPPWGKTPLHSGGFEISLQQFARKAEDRHLYIFQWWFVRSKWWRNSFWTWSKLGCFLVAMGLLDEISSNDLEEVCRKLDESNGDPAFLEQVVKYQFIVSVCSKSILTELYHYRETERVTAAYILPAIWVSWIWSCYS